MADTYAGKFTFVLPGSAKAFVCPKGMRAKSLTISLAADGAGVFNFPAEHLAHYAGKTFELYDDVGKKVLEFNIPPQAGFDVPLIVPAAPVVPAQPVVKPGPLALLPKKSATPKPGTSSVPAPDTPVAPTPAQDSAPEEDGGLEGATRERIANEIKAEQDSATDAAKRAELQKTLASSRMSILGNVVALLFVAALGYLVLYSPSNEAVGTGTLGLSNAVGNGIAKGTEILFVSALFSAFFAYANRRDNHQLGDILYTSVAFGLFTLGGFITYSYSDSFGNMGIPMLILLACILLTYIPAFDRGLDFSTAGTLWKLVTWFGVTFGKFGPLAVVFKIVDTTVVPLKGIFDGQYPGVDPKFTYILFFTMIFSAAHFAFDIWAPQVKSRKPYEWLSSLGFTAVLLISYYGVPFALAALNKPIPDPTWVLAVSLAVLGLVALPRKDRAVIEGDGAWRDTLNHIVTGSQLDGLSLGSCLIVLRILVG